MNEKSARNDVISEEAQILVQIRVDSVKLGKLAEGSGMPVDDGSD